MGNWKIILLLFVAAFFMGSCLPDGELKTELNMEPAVLNDGWEISTPEDEGFDEATLKEAYTLFFSEDEYVTGISLLIARNGKMVAEGYCRDMEDRDIKRNIQSATKSVTSLVFGIAHDEGNFDDLDQPLYDIMPGEFDSEKKKQEITLRHLMTMRSGLEFDNDDFAQEMHIESQKNQMEYILSKPLFADPGTKYWYRDCDPQLLGGAVWAKTKKTLAEIADSNLFGPMEITDYFWEKNEDGQNWAAQALFMRPRDMAKIGKLVLNNGRWEGQQLVSEEWIQQSTSYQTEFAATGGQDNGLMPDYGFYWWVYDIDYSRLPSVRAVSAVGAGGQYIFMVPELDLVIVMTSEPYAESDFSLEREFFTLAKMVINSIMDHVK